LEKQKAESRKQKSQQAWLGVVGGVAASVGENQTGAAIHRGVGGAHGVAARGNVIHEIDLAAAKAPERGFEAVRVGRGRGQVAAVAGALGFDWAGAAEGDRFALASGQLACKRHALPDNWRE